ncbi:MAG: hypothetical protein JOY78_15530 [Pseudonocardia sp.]|nr:hypothetical protein [Pseudonocardia sp.]
MIAVQAGRRSDAAGKNGHHRPRAHRDASGERQRRENNVLQTPREERAPHRVRDVQRHRAGGSDPANGSVPQHVGIPADHTGARDGNDQPGVHGNGYRRGDSSGNHEQNNAEHRRGQQLAHGHHRVRAEADHGARGDDPFQRHSRRRGQRDRPSDEDVRSAVRAVRVDDDQGGPRHGDADAQPTDPIEPLAQGSREEGAEHRVGGGRGERHRRSGHDDGHDVAAHEQGASEQAAEAHAEHPFREQDPHDPAERTRKGGAGQQEECRRRVEERGHGG